MDSFPGIADMAMRVTSEHVGSGRGTGGLKGVPDAGRGVRTRN
jgi:hypothetical protein